MNTLRNWLGGLLVLQLMLAGGLFVNSNTSRSGDSSEPLLVFDSSQLSKIVISNGKDQVTLSRQDNTWQLPALHDLPVSASKLNRVLKKLADLKTGWPIAKTKNSYPRFEVAKDKFQRHIQLYQGDKVSGELLLGSSPGFKKVHARITDGIEVYALPINTYEFPVKDNDWLDKKLLAAGGVTTIKGKDFVLTKKNDTWILADKKDDTSPGTLDIEKINQLGQALSTLTVTGVALHSPDINEESVTTLEVDGENNWHYQFFANEKHYYVKVDHMNQVFTLNKHEYDRVATIQLSTLILKNEEAKLPNNKQLVSDMNAD